jgi:hypothetical protein
MNTKPLILGAFLLFEPAGTGNITQGPAANFDGIKNGTEVKALPLLGQIPWYRNTINHGISGG